MGYGGSADVVRASPHCVLHHTKQRVCPTTPSNHHSFAPVLPLNSANLRQLFMQSSSGRISTLPPLTISPISGSTFAGADRHAVSGLDGDYLWCDCRHR